MSLNLQEHPETQSLNPSQFSLFMYNHGDATLSQIPLSAASNFHHSASTQFTNYSAVHESGLKNHLMDQELNGFDQNNNFQHLCVSNTQDYSALPTAQVSGLTNQLMQKEDLYGYDQNMCLSNINSNNFQHPCILNTQDHYELNQLMQHELYGYDDQNTFMSDSTTSNSQHPYQLCSDFQDPYSYMVSNTSLPQDMSTSCGVQFGESSLLQKSTLPSSLYTTPNNSTCKVKSFTPASSNKRETCNLVSVLSESADQCGDAPCLRFLQISDQNDDGHGRARD
ncbi:unnamed protein product [Arabis nemorensis]|uniref:Uncharacterized protein n=1 Tax=Arabis nemorensis TaxID=586526 RepID=A0A565C6M8_9BRAS|nr:unnamed protein product [Arabis nemorensis]